MCHAVDILEALGINLSFFEGEREHRELKRIARNGRPGDAGQYHVVMKSVAMYTHDLIDETSFEPTFLLAQFASPGHVPATRA
eukprot:1455804-Pyramimonas_sp.AAC.1